MRYALKINMCSKMKRPVKEDASERGSDRKAELQAKLDSFFKSKGLLKEDIMDSRKQESKLPPGISEEMLRERKVKYEGLNIGKDGLTRLHLFTITDSKKESLHSTIGVTVMDDSDILRMLDKKLKTVA